MDEDEVSAMLEHNGAFEKYFDGNDGRPLFESRLQQLDMLRAVTTALNKGRHMMIEAGTGIGKSFAYLLPAALWSTTNNQRVIVSTNTINLQDQLMDKDIPDLRAALGLDLRAGSAQRPLQLSLPAAIGVYAPSWTTNCGGAAGAGKSTGLAKAGRFR